MQYPLAEKIGNLDLLLGRKREFEQFGKWIAKMPQKISKPRVILARQQITQLPAEKKSLAGKLSNVAGNRECLPHDYSRTSLST